MTTFGVTQLGVVAVAAAVPAYAGESFEKEYTATGVRAATKTSTAMLTSPRKE
jgi:hypothetical protein